jgi:cardiolipin synthase
VNCVGQYGSHRPGSGDDIGLHHFTSMNLPLGPILRTLLIADEPLIAYTSESLFGERNPVCGNGTRRPHQGSANLNRTRFIVWILGGVPNLLSLCRLALAVVFPFLPPRFRLSGVVLAGITDLMDGPLSRILNAASVTGRLLDPLADKAFFFAVLGTLWYDGTLPIWHAALVAARDLTVSAGAIALLVSGRWVDLRYMQPTRLGKATTAGQLLWIMALLIGGQSARWLIMPVAILSCLAALDYLYRFSTRRR